MNRRRRILVCIAALASLAAAACDALISKPSLYGTITAQVLRRDSTPIPGTLIQLYTGQRPMGYATTDSSGTFRFVDIPDGVYGVRIVPPAGYVSINDIIGGGDSGVVHDGLVLPEQGSLFVRFQLLKLGSGNVGVFVENAERKPMSGIRVVLYTSAGSVTEGETDAQGRYAFPPVPVGNYGVFALRPPAFTDSAENPLPSRDGFVVDEGSSSTANFQFALCVGTLDVRVRDNTNAPVPGTLLSYYGNFGVQDSILGGEASRHITNVPCGIYGVRIRPPVGWTVNEGRGTTFQDNISIHRGTAADVTLRVTRIGRGTIRVRVVDDAGTPLPNIRTVVYTGQGLLADIVTDADGFASVPNLLVNSEYGVRIVPGPFYFAPEGSGSTYNDGVKLVDGETRDFVYRVTHN
ncbi:MAG: carboxypeptidase regulatory-like domain-containing protein [Gemmatimonadaceae bacterium]